MKNSFRKISVLILLLMSILIVAAAVLVPPALRRKSAAQAAVPAAEEATAGAATVEEPWDVVITIKADIEGKAKFVFEDYKIHFESEDRYAYPAGASVNGIPWSDLEKPFEMGFTPDFSFAKIYEKQGEGDIALSVENDQIIVSIENPGEDAAPYQVSIAMRRAPEPPAATEAEAKAEDDAGNADAVTEAEDVIYNADILSEAD